MGLAAPPPTLALFDIHDIFYRCMSFMRGHDRSVNLVLLVSMLTGVLAVLLNRRKMEIAQKAAEEEERYQKEMDKCVHHSSCDYSRPC